MSNPLAAFSLCGADFDEAVKHISAAGITQIALYFRPEKMPCQLETMTDADAKAMKDTLAEHGLAPIAAGGGSNVLAEDGLDLLVKKLDGAAKLGVSVFDTGSLATKDKDAETIERETALFYENMARAGDAAAERGVTICIETHGGLTGTVPSSLALMKRLNHPNIRIGYDPANIDFYEGASPVDGLEKLVPYIGHVHAKDHVGGKDCRDFPNVGEGDVPYAEILPTLRSGGYEGHISIERAPGETPDERLASLKEAHAFLNGLIG
ncbi:MAG: sugar phosphate isomerase/epimerase [Planctomycetes bacterium]|nr:sugar phosphate isomerase/epimerase [Planctomycetota bacterium]